jgi:hypothetical protein
MPFSNLASLSLIEEQNEVLMMVLRRRTFYDYNNHRQPKAYSMYEYDHYALHACFGILFFEDQLPLQSGKCGTRTLNISIMFGISDFRNLPSTSLNGIA